jgi:hypothetical protein
MITSMKILFCPRASALRDSMESQRTLHTTRKPLNADTTTKVFGKSAISPTHLLKNLFGNLIQVFIFESINTIRSLKTLISGHEHNTIIIRI